MCISFISKFTHNQIWLLFIFCLIFLQHPDGWSGRNILPSQIHSGCRQHILILTPPPLKAFSYSSSLWRHPSSPSPPSKSFPSAGFSVSVGLRQTTRSDISSGIWLLVRLLVTHPLLFAIFQYPSSLLPPRLPPDPPTPESRLSCPSPLLSNPLVTL